MNESGWDVAATFDNGVTAADVNVGLPVGQEEQYAADYAVCEEALGYDIVRTPNDEQIRESYKRTVEARDCLIEQGYAIPEMPSEGEYIDSYSTGGVWEVSSFVDVEGTAASEKLFATCVPPEWFPNY